MDIVAYSHFQLVITKYYPNSSFFKMSIYMNIDVKQGEKILNVGRGVLYYRRNLDSLGRWLFIRKRPLNPIPIFNSI